jgi:hypothetical protein
MSEPHKFWLPTASDMRFHWVHAHLAASDPTEAREPVVDAWRMVVPKKLSGAYDLIHPTDPRRGPDTLTTPVGSGAWAGVRRPWAGESG